MRENAGYASNSAECGIGTPFHPRLLQRKCACGGEGVECEEGSKHKELQRHAVTPKPEEGVPSIVHDALRSPGQPLDNSVRAGLEPQFGHDFSRVRVHTDTMSAASAEAVNALAYTVGQHLVFGNGQYSPNSASGRSLITHELAHVVQQGGDDSMPSEIRILTDFRSEAEAARIGELVNDELPFARPRQSADQSIQRQPGPDTARLLSGQLEAPPPSPLFLPGEIPEAIVLPAPPELQLTPPSLISPPERGLHLLPNQLTPLPFSPVSIRFLPRCVPDTHFTWADFKGRYDGSRFAAKTFYAVTDAVVQGNPMFQARFDQSKSWVRPKYTDPSNRAANGCASLAATCSSSMRGHPGRTWSTDGTPSAVCPASIVSTAVTATTIAECDTVVGAECDRVAPLESDRLLQHEQTHFDIACVFSNKGNDALRAGGSLAPIRTVLNTRLAQTERQYDTQTNHGCNQSDQDAWIADAQNGLPSITLP